VKLVGREEFIEADFCGWGTKYVILRKNGIQVAAYRTGEVKATEEIEDDRGTKLLAEDAELQQVQVGLGAEPDPDAN